MAAAAAAAVSAGRLAAWRRLADEQDDCEACTAASQTAARPRYSRPRTGLLAPTCGDGMTSKTTIPPAKRQTRRWTDVWLAPWLPLDRCLHCCDWQDLLEFCGFGALTVVLHCRPQLVERPADCSLYDFLQWQLHTHLLLFYSIITHVYPNSSTVMMVMMMMMMTTTSSTCVDILYICNRTVPRQMWGAAEKEKERTEKAKSTKMRVNC